MPSNVLDYIAGGSLDQLMADAAQAPAQPPQGQPLSPEAQQQLARLIQSPQIGQILQLAALGKAAAESLPMEIVQQLMQPQQAPNPGVEMLQAQPPLGGVPPSVL